MLLRRTALALGSLALVASLAACDLPGGTPPVVSWDAVPNDNSVDAPLVPVPVTIRGSVDADDWDDYYRLTPPATESTMHIVCTGEINISLSQTTQGDDASAAAPPVDPYCDGEPETFFVPVVPGAELYVAAHYPDTGEPITRYTITIAYGPVTSTTLEG